MTLEKTLNDLLVKLFKDILEIEAKSLITEEFKDISYNDMHIIEAVGIDEPRNMKTVAKLISLNSSVIKLFASISRISLNNFTRRSFKVSSSVMLNSFMIWCDLPLVCISQWKNSHVIY